MADIEAVTIVDTMDDLLKVAGCLVGCETTLGD
jgi:hypothetical protein